jgi:hypothetical protein
MISTLDGKTGTGGSCDRAEGPRAASQPGATTVAAARTRRRRREVDGIGHLEERTILTPGVPRKAPIDHALYCADQGYRAVRAKRAFEAKLTEACTAAGLTIEDALRMIRERLQTPDAKHPELVDPEPGPTAPLVVVGRAARVSRHA